MERLQRIAAAVTARPAPAPAAGGTTSGRPFTSLRVVEIAGSPAGAFTAKVFADYGCDVVKVEPKGGDPRRGAGEAWARGMGSQFAFFNTSKRSVELDLGAADGLAALRELLQSADVLIESSAPNPLTPLELGPLPPQLVRVLISPFGLSGPYAHFRSNVLTDDALGGHLILSGEPDRPPFCRAGLHTQLGAGMNGFVGAMGALLARDRPGGIGRGQSVEISHMEGMATMHQHTTSMWHNGGQIVLREGNQQPGPYYTGGVYPCKDGFVFLCHAGSAKLDPFMDVLERETWASDPSWKDDERFNTQGARSTLEGKKLFDAELLNPRLATLTVEEICKLGEEARSPLGPVPGMLEHIQDDHLAARDFWTQMPDQPELKFPTGPFFLNGQRSEPRPPPGGARPMLSSTQNSRRLKVDERGWPSGLRRCVQVAVYSCRRGFESHLTQKFFF